MTDTKAKPAAAVERMIKTIRYRKGIEEEVEFFAEKKTDPLRDGWLILKGKSHIDTRGKQSKEMFPSVNVDGLSFKPGVEFQCHPDHAKMLIDKDQVEIVKK